MTAEQIAAQAERFWSKVDRRGQDECWLWIGARDGKGYGTIMWNGRRGARATHAALDLDGRPRPGTEAWALHSCDNPPCVNPKHLRWGSVADNVADAIRSGTHAGGWQRNLTHCQRGHALTGDNVMKNNGGRRKCRACVRIHNARARIKRGQAVSAELRQLVETSETRK